MVIRRTGVGRNGGVLNGASRGEMSPQMSAQWSATRAREHLAMCGNFKASDLESWKSVCTSIPPASLKKNATLRSIVMEATHGILTTIYSFHTCIQNVIRRALADRIPAEIVAAAKISTRESRILAFS